MASLTIGALAARAGINLQTIRYYEREGLIPPPPRKSSGHRAYSPEALRRLRFIRHTRQLGFSLKEIRDLLSLRREPGEPCLNVIRQVEARTADVEQKIAQLCAIRDALNRLSKSCDGSCPVSGCPILENLDAETL